jgi:hypothetical protein
MDDPELVELLPEEEEPPPPPPQHILARRIAYQLITVICLKVATGIVIRNLAKNIREFDILYPESLKDVDWKVPQ